MIIDVHVHHFTGTPGKEYFPARHRWLVSQQWAYGTVPFRDPNLLYPTLEEGFSDPEGTWLIGEMDKAGIDAVFALPLDYGLGFGQESPLTIEEKHQHLGLRMKEHPGRVYGFAGMDPRRPEAMEIFERGIKDYGLRGLKVIPSNGYHVWDERLYPFYERCQEWGLPVAICTMCHFGGYDRGRFDDPIHLGDVVADFPDLKIIALHAGWPLSHWFETVLCMTTRAMNTYISLDQWVTGYSRPGQEMLEHWPNARGDERTLVRMIAKARDMLGAHRILFGTDEMPSRRFSDERLCSGWGWRNTVEWYMSLPALGRKYGVKFTNEEVELILGGNASRLMGITEDKSMDMKPYGWTRRSPAPWPKG